MLQRSPSFNELDSEPVTVADAIQSVALVSALVFGFAVSSFAAVMTELTDRTHHALIGWFCVCMSLVSMLSGYATVFLSLHFYQLKRFSKLDVELFGIYMKETSAERNIAQGLTWASLMLYFGSLSLLAAEILPAHFSTPCCVIWVQGQGWWPLVS